MKSTCILAAAAALFALNACKPKSAESGEGASTSSASTAPVKVSEMSADEYEKVTIEAMNESTTLLEKFASGGSKEDYIAGMKALAAKNAKYRTDMSVEAQEKAKALMESPKFKEAAEKASTRMQDVIAKHPDFGTKMMDPEVQQAMQDLMKN